MFPRSSLLTVQGGEEARRGGTTVGGRNTFNDELSNSEHWYLGNIAVPLLCLLYSTRLLFLRGLYYCMALLLLLVPCM
jgi:hypothetical protein